MHHKALGRQVPATGCAQAVEQTQYWWLLPVAAQRLVNSVHQLLSLLPSDWRLLVIAAQQLVSSGEHARAPPRAHHASSSTLPCRPATKPTPPTSMLEQVVMRASLGTTMCGTCPHHHRLRGTHQYVPAPWLVSSMPCVCPSSTTLLSPKSCSS